MRNGTGIPSVRIKLSVMSILVSTFPASKRVDLYSAAGSVDVRHVALEIEMHPVIRHGKNLE